MPTGTSINEVDTEIETQPLAIETKTRRCSK